MAHIEEQISKLKMSLESLSRTINGSLQEVNAHMDAVGHVMAEYTHDRKMESIGLMAGGVAHDFKNFLHVIGVNAKLIRDAATDEKTNRRAGQIVDVCRKASDLVGNMMALSKTDEWPTEMVDLNSEVQSCVALMKAGIPKQIQQKTEFADHLPAITGNASQICQVVSNLMKNAVEAMTGQGALLISTASVHLQAQDCIGHGNARPGRFAVLTVSDTGPGISPKVLPRIYDPFFSTKNGGGNSGFGLAIVYTIAQRHGGWIDVNSQEGKGTHFSVFFPLSKEDERSVNENSI